MTIQDVADLSGHHTNAAEAVSRAMLAVEVVLSWGRFPVWRDPHTCMKLRRDLPYVIHDTDETSTQILVNRQYKPLGSNLPDSSIWVRYEDYPQVHVRLTPTQISGVVCSPHERGLFDDGCPPWRGRHEATLYLERLQHLYEIIRAAT